MGCQMGVTNVSFGALNGYSSPTSNLMRNVAPSSGQGWVGWSKGGREGESGVCELGGRRGGGLEGSTQMQLLRKRGAASRQLQRQHYVPGPRAGRLTIAPRWPADGAFPYRKRFVGGSEGAAVNRTRRINPFQFSLQAIKAASHSEGWVLCQQGGTSAGEAGDNLNLNSSSRQLGV